MIDPLSPLSGMFPSPQAVAAALQLDAQRRLALVRAVAPQVAGLAEKMVSGFAAAIGQLADLPKDLPGKASQSARTLVELMPTAIELVGFRLHDLEDLGEGRLECVATYALELGFDTRLHKGPKRADLILLARRDERWMLVKSDVVNEDMFKKGGAAYAGTA